MYVPQIQLAIMLFFIERCDTCHGIMLAVSTRTLAHSHRLLLCSFSLGILGFPHAYNEYMSFADWDPQQNSEIGCCHIPLSRRCLPTPCRNTLQYHAICFMPGQAIAS